MSAPDPAQAVAEALDFAAGCSCCASNDLIADTLGVDHCGDPSSQMCDLDEDLSGDIQCDWHRAELSFRDLAQRAIDAAIAAARLAIEREAKVEAWDEGHEAGWWACYFKDDEPRNPYREADQ